MQRTNLVTNRDTFSNLFLMLVTALMVMPFFSTFNELLTRIIENTFLYKPIELFIVPYEINLVRTIISFFGIESIGGQKIFQIIKDGIPQGIYISWNCIGWQSFLILVVSLKTGLTDNFIKTSKIEIVILGILGTFLINILRISLVVLVFYFFGRLPAIILHDYGSILITILWL